MRPVILLIGVLLLSVQPVLAWDVTNAYSNQGGGNKDCGAPPPGVWTQIIADNAEYPCYANSNGIYFCEQGGGNDLDGWSYIVHGDVTFDTQIELRAASAPPAGVGPGTSIPLAMPTSVNSISEQYQPNDVLVTQLAAYTSGASLEAPTPPAGSTWTLITSTGTSTEQEWLFYHIAGSSEPSEYTWTFNTTVEAAAGGIADYANVSTSNPIGGVGASFTPNSGTPPQTITCPALNVSANQQFLCAMATFAGIPTGNWGTSPYLGFPGVFFGERWLFEYPYVPPPATPVPGLIDVALFDQPIRDAAGSETATANISPSADNAVISAALNPATGARQVSTVEVRTYVGPGNPPASGGTCTGGSTVTCSQGFKLLEDSTYAMPASNSLNVPFDAPEFNLQSYNSAGIGNWQAFYVFAMPTGGTVSCGDSYRTYESN